MPRPKGPLAPPLPLPHVIDPNAVYNVEAAQRCLHLRKRTIALEHKAGRLRVAKRAGRYYLLGKWLLEWLEAGEHRPKRKQPS
jgi:hypothetical protein